MTNSFETDPDQHVGATPDPLVPPEPALDDSASHATSEPFAGPHDEDPDDEQDFADAPADEGMADEEDCDEGGDDTSDEESDEDEFADEDETDEFDDDDETDDELADDDLADDAESDEHAAAADEALIGRFRSWLREARAEAEELAASDDEQNEAGSSHMDESDVGSRLPQGSTACEHEGVGIYRLVEELTALRQEVKLQARGSRGLEEEVAGFLPKLRDSLEVVRSFEHRVSGTLEIATRALTQSQAAASAPSASVGTTQFQSLALAIAELDDALDRGRRQLERSSEQLMADPGEALVAQLKELYSRQTALTRWASQGFYEEVRELLGSGVGDEQRQSLHEALVDGYGLIQQRLARLMAKEDITRLVSMGQEVDPEQMVVVEAVATGEATEQREGIVVEEIRRGYLWRGRVLRFAEVKATRAMPTSGPR